MSLHSDDQDLDGFHQTSLRGGGPYEPYEPSIASSASSSQASIFSDSGSVQSSIASSVSDDFRQSQEEARDRACAQAQIRHQVSYVTCNEPLERPVLVNHLAPSYADVTSVPVQQRQHPRRSSLARNQKPPTLQRQQDRKTNFVDSLVDSATQMVEVIWPLSVVPCRSEGGNGRGVLPLRTYIEETLRRSRTSYSTLQVALYYLVLIKTFVPRSDFTQEQQMDCPASRALMCGRRMFLAALILASKYLQDRNYSTKAWSKMSGLPVSEINTNERTFLGRVDFKLHIPDPVFKRWQEIVLKYTPNTQPPSPGQGLGIRTTSWKGIIPFLTPELDNVPISASKFAPVAQCSANYGCSPPSTPTPTPATGALASLKMDSTSQESTPTPTTVQPPRFLEPTPDLLPPTPALARMGPLPTPQLTPSSVASSTPAVSACGSRRPSMCSAMALAQKSGFSRCAMDSFPSSSTARDTFDPSRRQSVASLTSARSSPESLISDRSRSSRASSISSISTVSSTASTLAPHRAHLARQATCRNARLPLPSTVAEEEKHGSTAAQPILIVDTDTEMASSPEPADFSCRPKALHTPHRHSKHAPTPASAPTPTAADKSRKRCRSSRANRRSALHEEVRQMLEEDLHDEMDIDGSDGADDDNYDDDGSSDLVSSSPAAAPVYAARMLARTFSAPHANPPAKQIQPPASLSRGSSPRMPVPSAFSNGNKRSCCSSSLSAAQRTGASPARPRTGFLYGEVA